MTAEERLAFALMASHPEEAARIIEGADPSAAAAVVSAVAPAVAARVFRAIGPTPSAACAAAMAPDDLAAIVAELTVDIAAGLIRQVDPARRELLFPLLAPELADQLRLMLRYPENTAGAMADPLVLAVAEDITVADAQRRLRGSGLHLHYYVYVISRDGVLTGVLSIGELMAARGKDALAAVMHRDVVRLDGYADLATVEAHPAWRDYDALPVVDSGHRLVGAIQHKEVRQLAGSAARPMMATFVGLSELYWAGLTRILRSLGPLEVSANGEGDDAAARKEADHVS